MVVTMSTTLPKCVLAGTDGNVFAVIGNVSRALKDAGQHDRATEFRKRALESHSYDDVLQLSFQYVDVH